MSAIKLFKCFLIIAVIYPSPSLGEKKQDIPEALKPWKSWVLYGKETYACPRAYNASDEFFCVWPEMLDLDLNDSGGSFKQKITVFSSSHVPLPGDSTFWPLSVSVDGEAAPVLSRNGIPSVDLEEGGHTVTGQFTWSDLPAFFTVPEHTGLVSLRVNNSMIPSPVVDSENRLWINKKDRAEIPAEDRETDSITVSVFRLIEDDNPMTLETVMELSVSGDNRREKLQFDLPDLSSVVSVNSPLPLKLMEDGTLWVDVKAGAWTIRITAVINAPSSAIGPLKAPYGEEIWSFKPRTDLRIVGIEDVQAVDPMQVSMPDAWKTFSAYRITEGSRIIIHENQRGCSGQSPDTLSLSRELWLDFDGKGATVRDYISGSMGTRRFFSMNDQEYNLGRIASKGTDQLITRLTDQSQGIELERGPLSLEAVSRLKQPASGKPFSLGWDSEYQSADMSLNLPPGWQILGLSGGTAPSDTTWLNRWSMLDLFLILLVAYGAIRLWSPLWGLIFLSGLALICHEPLSPFYVWAFFILITALIRFKIGPNNGLPTVIKTGHRLLLAILVIYSVLFSVNQIRVALHPQLESLGGDDMGYDLFTTDSTLMAPPPEPFPESDSRMMETMDEPSIAKMMPIQRKPAPVKKTFRLSSENIITQTGPAIPTWNWKTVAIQMGQVPASHTLNLWLVSPTQNALLALFRVGLVLIMLLRFIPIRFPDRTRHKNKHETALCLALLAGITSLFLLNPMTAHADFPSPQLLSDLENRLTEPADCFPDCATLSDLSITLPDEIREENGRPFIRLDFKVNAAVRTAIPLPSGMGTWELYDMTLDASPYLTVSREDQSLWTLVPQGVHQISLRGLPLGQSRLTFSFPLKPAQVHVQGKNWNIIGLDQNMQTENTLMAIRKTTAPDQATMPAKGQESTVPEKPLSDVVRVERTLALDREWTVTTLVQRFPGTDVQKSVVINLPLIKDEKVRTALPGLSLDKGGIQVSLAPGNQNISWTSSLPITESLELSIPKDATWSEIWKLDLSSRWHLTAQGLPMACPDNSGLSLWYPWPGEHLSLSLAQLEPAPGNYFTIDSASVDYYIEKGSNRIVLSSRLRTSQGRPYSIPTPENCIVKTVRVNGRDLPVSGNPERIDVSLSPGAQTLDIEWNQADPWDASFIERFIKPGMIAFPHIDMGNDVANITMNMHLPEKSWLVYTHGPTWGPALVTWGLCGLVLIAALILGRLSISPLPVQHWMILGLGMALSSLKIHQILLVAGWFLIMELRKNKAPVSPLLFNLMQLGLMIWTACVIFAFFQAVSKGLLHMPDMQVSGNGSTEDLLIWSLDRTPGLLPSPWIAVYSTYTYHLLMLFWSLWLAIHLLPWSRFAVAALKSDAWYRPLLFVRGKRKLK